MVCHNFRKGQKVYCILKMAQSTGHYLELDNYKVL